MLADEPDGTDDPDGAPSTNASEILIPLNVAVVPADAWWNSSVGASVPASHPAMAGSSRTRAPISVRRATVLRELRRITADASSGYGNGRDGEAPGTSTWPGCPLQAVEIVPVGASPLASGRWVTLRSGRRGTLVLAGRGRAGRWGGGSGGSGRWR